MYPKQKDHMYHLYQDQAKSVMCPRICTDQNERILSKTSDISWNQDNSLQIIGAILWLGSVVAQRRLFKDSWSAAIFGLYKACVVEMLVQ